MNLLLTGTGIRTTRLGFGLSKLMRVPSREERRRLLEAAFDLGIRHFDVARMYGLGEAEHELGHFIKSRRDQVVIATKFGIEPSGTAGRFARFQSPVRWLFRRFPKLRQAVIREDRRPRPPRLFTPDAARRSLETSLLALRSDYVDIFFLHEPTCQGDISSGLYECMEQLKSEGKIRAYGLSCMARDMRLVVAAHPNLCHVLQFDNDACSRQIDLLTPAPGADILTFSPLSAALPVLEDLCARQQACIRRIFSETGVDLENRKSRLALLLAYALYANPHGPVVFASTSTAHITEIVTCVGGSLPEEPCVDVVVEKLAAAINGPAVLVG